MEQRLPVVVSLTIIATRQWREVVYCDIEVVFRMAKLPMSRKPTTVLGLQVSLTNNVQTRLTDSFVSSTGKLQHQQSIDQRYHQKVSKTLSSDESILSTAGSVIVEENVSSESEHSSQDSGVYKNIIINLGNLVTPEHQSAPEMPTNYHHRHSSGDELDRLHGPHQLHRLGHSQSYLPDGAASSNNGASRLGNELVGILKKSK